MSDDTNTTTDTTTDDTTTETPNRYSADDLAALVNREQSATVRVNITPRDVAILVSLGNGAEQTDMADMFQVHRQTILKLVTRLYSKLGTRKATEAYAVAGEAGSVLFRDRNLTTDNLVDLYAADRDWSRVGVATLADSPADDDDDDSADPTNGDLTVTTVTGDDLDKLKSDADAAKRRNRKTAGIPDDK
jgi:DNA-binding CsgD family transcriptional regulator